MEAMTLEQVVRFLLGEAELDGVWFGEKPEGERGNFWWRKHLRQSYSAHLTQPAQGRGEAVVGAKGKFISESGYCFSGTLDSVLYKVWLNDGSLVTIGRDEFILDANPTRSSPATAPDDARLHSGSAEDVAQWLYANGHHDAAFTVRQQLDVRNERIRALESTHLAQPAQAVDATGRSAKNYAIEHAGYMARGATRLIDAINDLELARQQFEEGDGSEDATNAAEQSLGDAMSALRSLIYEFEKRRDRALSGEKAGPVGDGKYRLLDHGDVIEPDDEFIADNAVDWVPVKSNQGAANLFVGMQYRLGTLKQARRPLPASPTPDKDGA